MRRGYPEPCSSEAAAALVVALSWPSLADDTRVIGQASPDDPAGGC